MRKCYTILALIAVLALGLFASAALAGNGKPPAPPGQGECEHGNSGKPCRDDPQPEKGKDCDTHGKQGGVNEDHCKGTTPPPTTPEETTSTTTTTEQETTSNSTTPAESSSPPSDSAPTPRSTPAASSTDTPSSESLEEQLEEQAKANGATNAPGTPQAAGELPYTGFEVWMAVVIGLGLSGAGLLLRRWGRT